MHFTVPTMGSFVYPKFTFNKGSPSTVTYFSEGLNLRPFSFSSFEIYGRTVYVPDFTSKQYSPSSLVVVLLSDLVFSVKIIVLFPTLNPLVSELSESTDTLPHKW